MPMNDGSGGGPPGQLDRPPSLPPEVQASTFNQLAGQGDPSAGAGPSAGGMQIATIVGQLGMQIEMMTMKLGQLVPGSESLVGGIQQMVRQMAMQALQGGGQTQQPIQPQSPSPDQFSSMAGSAPQGPQGPPSMSMGGPF